ncbi:MAG: UDP-2,3-diacylglucosamine diphosphatase [Oligoflexia bacterium]|nr:UDP-2,3-diacylglucosamine diphosphatase [Oligoflexia bacterium]
MGRILFLSDLHLDFSNQSQIDKFCAFLRAVPSKDDILVFGGDIFDLFVGNKSFWKIKYSAIFESFRELEEKNIKIKYLEGNHDFYFNKLFKEFTFIEVYKDDFEILFSGKKIFISHGDLIDPEDKGYRLLRFIFRSKGFEFFVSVLPGWVIQKIGEKSSGVSHKYNREDLISESNKLRLKNLYKRFAESKIKNGYDFVLIGHSHLADNIIIDIENNKGQYINNGFSSEGVLYSVLESNRSLFEVKKF